jgi:threonine dehydrogenase-like Zn-dependent dehydrogenase
MRHRIGMSKTMPTLTFVRKHHLEWRDVAMPRLQGARDALVRPIVASRCDGDCLFLFHDYSRALQLGVALHVIDPDVRELGARPFAGPFAYGHECIAEVIDVGDGVRSVAIGVSPLRLAGASDNLPDAWRTVAPHLRDELGAPVLVVGGAARSIGLYAAGIAVALGSSQVDYVDDDRANLAIAETLGAHPIAMRPQRRWLRSTAPPLPMRYPITVDASNREAGLELAIRALSPGGVCTAVGFYFRTGTPLPLWHMYLKGARLHVGVSNPRADLPDVLDLVASGRFDPTRVTARVADWDEAPTAPLDRDAAKVVVARRDVDDPVDCSAVEVRAL